MSEENLFGGTFDPHPAHPETTPRKLSEEYLDIRFNLIHIYKILNDNTDISISEWFVKPGERVKRGEMIAMLRIDPDWDSPCFLFVVYISRVNGYLDKCYINKHEPCPRVPNLSNHIIAGRISYDTEDEENKLHLPNNLVLGESEVDSINCVAYLRMDKRGRSLDLERTGRSFLRRKSPSKKTYNAARFECWRKDAQANVARLTDEISDIEQSKSVSLSLSDLYAKVAIAAGGVVFIALVAIGWLVAALLPSEALIPAGIIWTIAMVIGAVVFSAKQNFFKDLNTRLADYTWQRQFPDRVTRLAEATKERAAWSEELAKLG